MNTTGMRIWTISNGLSFFRMLLPVPVVFLSANFLEHRSLLLCIFVLTWLTDIGDGYIARRFDQESDFGRIIDPLADKIFVSILVLLLLWKNFLPIWYVLVVLLRDVFILAGGIYLKKKSGTLAQLNYLGKAAVLSIGVCLILSLFQHEMDSAIFFSALLVSTLFLAASFALYMKRLWQKDQ